MSTYILQFGGNILNLRDFSSGDCFDVYKWLGAQFDGFGTTFRVYAPNAEGVSVIGDFNRVNVSDVTKLMGGDGTGRVQR